MKKIIIFLTQKLFVGANGPITSRADKLLNHNNVLIIPDLYANAGGVAVIILNGLKPSAYEIWKNGKKTKRI